MNLHRLCGEDFASLGSFDAHLVENHEYTLAEGLKMDPPREDGARCLSVVEMEQAGWTKDKKGRWREPGFQDDEPFEDLAMDRVVL